MLSVCRINSPLRPNAPSAWDWALCCPSPLLPKQEYNPQGVPENQMYICGWKQCDTLPYLSQLLLSIGALPEAGTAEVLCCSNAALSCNLPRFFCISQLFSSTLFRQNFPFQYRFLTLKSLSLSRRMSFLAMESRLSYNFLPRARAISSFTRLPLK